MACVTNFAEVPHHGYRVGLPFAGVWEEVFNSDSELNGGSGVGNLGSVTRLDEPWHARPAWAQISVPPLGAGLLTFKRD